MSWLGQLIRGEAEAGLALPRLQPGRARGQRRLVPWWVRAMRRAKAANVMRRQARSTAGGGGARRAPVLSKVNGRRSVVKASYLTNRGKGGWVRHARYLGREHAQHEHERGLGFNGEAEGLDLVATVRPWEQADDQLLWKIIASPEDAARLDLVAHTRALVAGMERDLGTRLEWVAIDHHNTDNAHVHLLLRGVREDGQVLRLDRDYVSRGIRELSQELIERELGPRTEHEVLLAREHVIEREQWTEIDRALARRAGPERVVSYEGFMPWTEGARVRAEQEIARLAYLEKLGLARRIEERSWELTPEHEPELRKRQLDHDIIKTRARERQLERDRGRDRGPELER
jgi:type IV secretory pathway VirD2 relaxase